MNLNLTKISTLVLLLGSGSAMAGSMGPVCSAVNVTVPCESTGWDIGAKALYLKPAVNPRSGYGPYVAADVDVAPNYNWGFQVEGSYHFSTGQDLNINWYHVNNSRSGALGVTTLPGTTLTNPQTGSHTSTTLTGGTSSIDPKWDAVNFEFGHHTDFGDNKAIRFHGGAQYARVENTRNHTVNALLVTNGVSTPYTHTSIYNPTYNGFGPRVGMDMSYHLNNGLGIYANGAIALLVGSRAYNYTYTDLTGNIEGFNGSNTAVVPALDAKLGITYDYAMAQGTLTLDAGWMWVDYVSAHTNTSGTNFDVSLQGLEFGLKWLGNVA